jgi:hypothetical protein
MTTETFDIEAMKRKIAALLAKAEGTTNNEERDAYSKKAEELMLRLGVGVAELESTGQRKADPIVEVKRVWKGNYSIVMLPFVQDVASGFGNLTILQTSYSPMLRQSYIIGHQSDVEQFCTLIDSLFVQVMAALKRWQREVAAERRRYTDMEKYTGNRSFIAGFGKQVAIRLYQTRRTEESKASTGAALVLVSKQARVDDWVSEAYPKLGKARGGMKTHDWYASRAGHEAGEKADLGAKRLGGKGELNL